MGEPVFSENNEKVYLLKVTVIVKYIPTLEILISFTFM
jgi:hypothetical protein